MNNPVLQDGQHTIKVRKGDFEVEVSSPDKDFVTSQINRLLEEHGGQSSYSSNGNNNILEERPVPQIAEASFRTMKPETLNEFYRKFKLQTHLDKILVLGYWCEMKDGKPEFGAEDVLAKYKEAKEQSPANIRRDMSSLVAKGLLRADKGSGGSVVYSLTNTGISEVETKLSPEK